MVQKLSALFGLIFLAAGPLPAAQIIEKEISCPVCGREYYAKLDVPDPISPTSARGRGNRPDGPP